MVLAVRCSRGCFRVRLTSEDASAQDILEAALKLADDLACTQPAPMDASPGPESPILDPSAGEATAPATVADAAQPFASLLEFDESAALNPPHRIFAKGRVLWQQRAFSVAADLLLEVCLYPASALCAVWRKSNFLAWLDVPL